MFCFSFKLTRPIHNNVTIRYRCLILVQVTTWTTFVECLIWTVDSSKVCDFPRVYNYRFVICAIGWNYRHYGNSMKTSPSRKRILNINLVVLSWSVVNPFLNYVPTILSKLMPLWYIEDFFLGDLIENLSKADWTRTICSATFPFDTAFRRIASTCWILRYQRP